MTTIHYRLHPSLTSKAILHAVERSFRTLDNPAFCINCGRKYQREPDARGEYCAPCGKPGIYGAEEILCTFRLK